MMEQPSPMSPSKIRRNSSIRLAVFAAGATLVGCSLNPFADDEPVPTPAAAPASAPSGSTSLEPGAASQTEHSQPALQQISRPVPLAEGAPEEYTVQVGDTLWDIAATFLKDPWYWPEVWYVNPQVENPHLIYPGDVLALVMIGGEQRITNIRAATYRLSPQARVTPLTEAIESIPYEQISAFLSRGLVLERGEIEDLPYILSVRGEHMVAATGNDVYVRGGAASPNGTRYSVVTIGEELVDPDDNEVIGYQGIYVGEGAMLRGGDPATVSLTESTREAQEGDRLIPETVDIPLNFFPKSPSVPVDGRIISVIGGVALISQYQVVVINRGAQHGLAPGDVLSAYDAGEVVHDRFAGSTFVSKTSLFAGEKVRLPDEEAGTIMIFKVYDRIGYGLVMEATQAIRIHDPVRNPT